MDVSLIARIFPFLIQAAGVTVGLSVLALGLGLMVGAAVTACRLSSTTLLRAGGTLYVSIFRGTPCLIQMFVIYFGGPQIGLNLEPFAAGVLSLGLNIGAYIAEAMRGSILAVDRGQSEAARSIGFSQGQTMRIVILPQAARLMIRSLGVNAVMLVKGSALVSSISVVELTYTAQRFVGSTYRPFEVLGAASAIYMVLIYGLVQVVNYVDRRYTIR